MTAIKFASEPLEEVVYSEDDGGLMVPEFRSAVRTYALAGGNLAYMRVERLGEEPFVVVFGWKVGQELLPSGFLKTYVRPVGDDRRELMRRLAETDQGCHAVVW